MALYDYRCVSCGVFEAWAPIRECAERRPCPQCRQASARIPSSIHLASASSALYAREERCRHEPASLTCKVPTPEAGAAHGRPWMLGH